MKKKNEIEIKIILRALELLSDINHWVPNSVYGEDCESENPKLTIGRTLVKTQNEIRGFIKNRSKEMWVLGITIYFHYFWCAGIHPITYFNRNQNTTHSEIIKVLQLAIQKLKS